MPGMKGPFVFCMQGGYAEGVIREEGGVILNISIQKTIFRGVFL